MTHGEPKEPEKDPPKPANDEDDHAFDEKTVVDKKPPEFEDAPPAKKR